jgi:hypothetical protein
MRMRRTGPVVATIAAHEYRKGKQAVSFFNSIREI